MSELRVVEGRRLGRRPPSNRPALRLEPSLTGIVPAAPAAADHFARVPRWILGGNDKYGDCGPVSVANNLLLTTTYLTSTPVAVGQTAIFDLYRASGNPTFDPTTGVGDDGVDMQTMLEALVKVGIGGYKPLGFAKVTSKDLEVLRAVEAIFGSVLLGVDLQTAQESQTDKQLWDYQLSKAWGGHAIMSGRYVEAPDRTACVTWAEVVDMTDAFLTHQDSEQWVVIWPWHLADKTFLEGVNLGQLAADYQALTGRPFPATVPPTPVPSPTVQPCIDPADRVLASAVKAWSVAGHSGANAKAAKAVKAWLAAKGL